MTFYDTYEDIQKKYTINGHDTMRVTDNFGDYDQKYSVWSIECDGVVISKIYGPGSLSIALAACERLNSVNQREFWDGWTGRANKLMNKGE